MSYKEVEYPKDKAEFYVMLKDQLRIYTDGEADVTAVLANASAVIAQAFDNVNWVGFYLVKEGELVLGPFQGKPAVSRIGYGLGVCGAAWRDGCPKVVGEVACFEGHIACDCNTHSEIVIPIRTRGGEIYGVLDMDSTAPEYFSDADRDGLLSAVEVIAEKLAG